MQCVFCNKINLPACAQSSVPSKLSSTYAAQFTLLVWFLRSGMTDIILGRPIKMPKDQHLVEAGEKMPVPRLDHWRGGTVSVVTLLPL